MSQLFDDEPSGAEQSASDAPLAARMRPATAEELVGQEHLVTAGSPLGEALRGRALHSMILYGPPGTGKTTIARLIAVAAEAAFDEESAVAAGRAEVRAVIERARQRRDGIGRPTIFFLDEIHRFNKAQQDALLPAVEDGTITLIGATTENPFFEVNSALMSRTRLYELQPLDDSAIETLIRRAVTDPRGLGDRIDIDDEAVRFLASQSGGDARIALGALETAAEIAGDEPVSLELAQQGLQRRAVLYDRDGDRHYDYISALIKSMRGSDPDAALYYLAVMLEGGEDPRFIARRIFVLASEDIGNADPQALQIASAAAHAVDFIGMPEARINLGQAVVYMALAPKSNASYKGISRAIRRVREDGPQLPPAYLRDAHYPGAKKLGRGLNYDYPHDSQAGVSGQELKPDGIGEGDFYTPSNHGYERDLAQRLEAIRKAKHRSGQPE